MLTEGLNHTSSLTVTADDTALRMGSGDLPVLATPRLVALMENAAMLAVAPALGADDTTVGGHIHVSHLAPSPEGSAVTATATLTRIEGRKLIFDIVARQGATPVGEATHVRYIVNRERFKAKALAGA